MGVVYYKEITEQEKNQSLEQFASNDKIEILCDKILENSLFDTVKANKETILQQLCQQISQEQERKKSIKKEKVFEKNYMSYVDR